SLRLTASRAPIESNVPRIPERNETKARQPLGLAVLLFAAVLGWCSRQLPASQSSRCARIHGGTDGPKGRQCVSRVVGGCPRPVSWGVWRALLCVQRQGDAEAPESPARGGKGDPQQEPRDGERGDELAQAVDRRPRIRRGRKHRRGSRHLP